MQRVFIGIPVNQKAQQQINKLLNPYQRSEQGIKWVPGENRHLTLTFFGERSDWEIENLVRSMDGAYHPRKAFQTGTATLARFPDSMGNIIALVFEADAYLTRLFQVSKDLMKASRLGSDLKPFRPHITLARIRKANHLDTTFPQPTNIRLQVDKITLYQSTLIQGTRVYHALKEIDLG